MKGYNSTDDTLEHIHLVNLQLTKVVQELIMKKRFHDESKLESPEKEIFDIVTPKLKNMTYGSQEYKKSLEEMGEALDHHYLFNRHHPEHFPQGIEGMNLMDLLEMVCDWKSATMRHADGDIQKSLVINKERFGISDQLIQIISNTVDYLETGE